MKNSKILLLLLLTTVFLVITACGSQDAYTELSRHFSLTLPAPLSQEFRSGGEKIDQPSLSESFVILLQYSEEAFQPITELEEWNALSHPELREVSSLLLNYYQQSPHAATPKQRLDALNGLLEDPLELGDKWYMTKDWVVPGDRLLFLLEEPARQIRAYYLTP